MVRSRACPSDDELIWKSVLPQVLAGGETDERPSKRSRDSDDVTSIATAVSEIAGHDVSVRKSTYAGLEALMDNERERLRCDFLIAPFARRKLVGHR